MGLLVTQSGVGYTLGQEQHFALGLFLGGMLIAALGVYDDLRGAGARKKFAVQFAVAGIMYFLGFSSRARSPIRSEIPSRSVGPRSPSR